MITPSMGVKSNPAFAAINSPDGDSSEAVEAAFISLSVASRAAYLFARFVAWGLSIKHGEWRVQRCSPKRQWSFARSFPSNNDGRFVTSRGDTLRPLSRRDRGMICQYLSFGGKYARNIPHQETTLRIGLPSQLGHRKLISKTLPQLLLAHFSLSCE